MPQRVPVDEGLGMLSPGWGDGGGRRGRGERSGGRQVADDFRVCRQGQCSLKTETSPGSPQDLPVSLPTLFLWKERAPKCLKTSTSGHPQPFSVPEQPQLGEWGDWPGAVREAVG